jgi:hypothetical protein
MRQKKPSPHQHKQVSSVLDALALSAVCSYDFPIGFLSIGFGKKKKKKKNYEASMAAKQAEKGDEVDLGDVGLRCSDTYGEEEVPQSELDADDFM